MLVNSHVHAAWIEKKVSTCSYLTLFKMGFFGASHGWGEGGWAKSPPPKICHTYPTMMKLGPVIPHPKKIQKVYKSPDTPLELC